MPDHRLCASLKWKVIMCVVLFCFPDASGQVGSHCPQASFIPSSEGAVSGPQQHVDVPCHVMASS